MQGPPGTQCLPVPQCGVPQPPSAPSTPSTSAGGRSCGSTPGSSTSPSSKENCRKSSSCCVSGGPGGVLEPPECPSRSGGACRVPGGLWGVLRGVGLSQCPGGSSHPPLTALPPPVDNLDPNFQSDAQSKRTPLHAAAQKGYLEICHLLLQVGWGGSQGAPQNLLSPAAGLGVSGGQGHLGGAPGCPRWIWGIPGGGLSGSLGHRVGRVLEIPGDPWGAGGLWAVPGGGGGGAEGQEHPGGGVSLGCAGGAMGLL